MLINTSFNTLRNLTQLWRYHNMAKLKGSESGVKIIQPDKVQVIPDMSQFANGSHNTNQIISAIAAGKGLVKSSKIALTENGSMLPDGVPPSRVTQDFEPLFDFAEMESKVRELNETLREQVSTEQAKKTYKKSIVKPAEINDVELGSSKEMESSIEMTDVSTLSKEHNNKTQIAGGEKTKIEVEEFGSVPDVIEGTNIDLKV